MEGASGYRLFAQRQERPIALARRLLVVSSESVITVAAVVRKVRGVGYRTA
jgi:hypothetical protein